MRPQKRSSRVVGGGTVCLGAQGPAVCRGHRGHHRLAADLVVLKGPGILPTLTPPLPCRPRPGPPRSCPGWALSDLSCSSKVVSLQMGMSQCALFKSHVTKHVKASVPCVATTRSNISPVYSVGVTCSSTSCILTCERHFRRN